MIFLHFSFFFQRKTEESHGICWYRTNIQHQNIDKSIPDLSMLKHTVISSLVHQVFAPRWSQYEININKYQQTNCYTKIKLKTINKISTPSLKQGVLK